MTIQITRATKTNTIRKRRSRRGGVMLVTALAMPIMAGFAGLGVDAGIWATHKRGLQTAADAAAISGALEKVRGYPMDSIRYAANREATRNGFHAAADSTIAVYNPPTTGAYAGDPQSIEVWLTRPEKPLLASLIFGNAVTLRVRSVATMQALGKACVLALDPSAAGAATVWGNTNVDLSGCVIAANSSSSTAIDIGGSAALTAASLWTVGGYSQGGSSSMSLAAEPRTHAWAIQDPFAGIQMPSTSGCAGGNNLSINNTLTLSPGVYCDGIDIQAQGIVTLNPGTYVINRGDFNVAGGATVTCDCPNPGDGVTIILTSSTTANQIGQVRINGGAIINLRAPSAVGADYRGMLLIQDPRASSASNLVDRFNGGATMVLKGAIYFPSQEVEYSGNNGGTDCIEIVAREVTFTGNSRLNVSGCAAAGTPPVQLTVVRVVE